MFTIARRASACGFAILATVAPSNAAPEKSFESRVAASKQAIMRTADQAFLESWQDAGESAEKASINPTQARTWVLWGTLGATLGVCREFALPSDRADWLTKLDRLDTGGGVFAEEAKLKARQLGINSFEGMTPDQISDLTPAEQRELCSTELAAFRQILKEMH